MIVWQKQLFKLTKGVCEMDNTMDSIRIRRGRPTIVPNDYSIEAVISKAHSESPKADLLMDNMEYLADLYRLSGSDPLKRVKSILAVIVEKEMDLHSVILSIESKAFKSLEKEEQKRLTDRRDSLIGFLELSSSEEA